MTSLLRRNAPRSTAAVTPALRGVAVSVLVLVLAAGAYPARSQAAVASARRLVPADGGAAPVGATQRKATADGAHAAAPFGRIILPDLLVVEPKGLSPRTVARIRKITGVRNMLAFDGARDQGGRPPGQRDRRQPGPVQVLDAAADCL